LLLQWPIVVLAGMRRFYGRREWRAPAWVDGALLAAAFVAWFIAWVAGAGPATRVAVFSGGAVVLHAYSAALLSRLPEFRRGSALKVLAATQLAIAAVQAMRIGQAARGSADSPEETLATGLLVVLTALVMVYLSLLLSGERTEMHLRIARRKLQVLANIDTLTQLPNRRHFHELADAALKVSPAPNAALMMFDIDHFKQINDRLGHAVGDEGLKQVGICVRDTLRQLDIAGRLGGDEFAVLLPATGVHDAMSVASRIVMKLEHRQVAPRIAPLNLSFGVVQIGAGESMTDALHRADQALYEAKRQGRNRAVAASGDTGGPVFARSRRMRLTVL
jgi:diguanylate cyclase (GGDEF)-like protein